MHGIVGNETDLPESEELHRLYDIPLRVRFENFRKPYFTFAKAFQSYQLFMQLPNNMLECIWIVFLIPISDIHTYIYLKPCHTFVTHNLLILTSHLRLHLPWNRIQNVSLNYYYLQVQYPLSEPIRKWHYIIEQT